MGKHTHQRTRRTPFVWVLLALIVAALLFVALQTVSHHRSVQSPSAYPRTTSSTITPETQPTSVGKNPVPQPNQTASERVRRQKALDSWQLQINQRIREYPGTWQVYAEDLATGAHASINNHVQPAASLIKLYIMLAAYQQINDGSLTRTQQTDTLLSQMITVSSNAAANSLIEQLGKGDDQQGFAVINQTAQHYGFTQTTIADLLSDTGSLDPNHKTTSSLDCGRFMAMVYRKQLVSPQASAEMENLLLGQQRRSKIPAGVPAGTKVANKTGEIPGVENDTAIVFAPHGDYVLTVMTHNQTNSSTAQSDIRELSSATWSTLDHS